jgi:phosphoglycolate phosphatase-like HAD superfamily hydrolase
VANNRAGVVFDIDGTLLDTNYLHVLAWWQAFRDTGHQIAMWRLHRSIGIASEELVKRLLGAADDDVVQAHSAAVRGAARPGHGVPAGGRAAGRVHRAWAHGRAGHQRDEGRPGVDAAGDRRPGRRGGRRHHVRGRRGGQAPSRPARGGPARPRLDRGRTVAVGDTVWDVESARSAHLPCVALLSGGIGVGELGGAEAVYDDPAALLDRLGSSPLARLGVLGALSVDV